MSMFDLPSWKKVCQRDLNVIGDRQMMSEWRDGGRSSLLCWSG